MHELSRHDAAVDLRQVAAAPPPFGPGFPADAIAEASTLVVMGADFSDPGADFCTFTLYDASGNVLATRRTDGY